MGRARAGIYISDQIKYRIMLESETKSEPVIWIEVFQAGNKKFTFQNYYRQWRKMDSEGSIEGTESDKAQKKRLNDIVTKWAENIERGDCISTTDININLNHDFNYPSQLQEHDRAQIPLVRMLNETHF